MLSVNHLFEIKKAIKKEKNNNDHWYRKNIKPGQKVLIVLKKDQKTGQLTRGVVESILTSKYRHTRGIKVRLKNGKVGRVQKIL